MPLPIHLSAPPAVVVEPRAEQQTTAQQRALQAADELGCSLETFAPFHAEGSSGELFTCSRGGEKFILKAHLGRSASDEAWPEPLYASLAARGNFAPPTYPIQSVPGIMASKFLEGRPLQAAELRKVDMEIVSLLGALHQSVAASDVDGKFQGDRSDLFARAFQELARKETQSLLGEAAAANFYDRLSWLQGELEPLPFISGFLIGKIEPGKIIREDGQLRMVDWEAAHLGDPLLDLAQLSFAARTPNSRLLKYLDHYTTRSDSAGIAKDQRRVLLQQAVNNVREFLAALKGAGLGGYKSEGIAVRLFDDEKYLVEMPRVMLPASSISPTKAPFFAKDIKEARQLAELFVSTMLPPGSALGEALSEPKAHFAYFRVTESEQDWFVKVFFGVKSDTIWTEPSWMLWAADERFGPEVEPASGAGGFANILATTWISGDHLDRTTANLPHIRAAVLKQMRQLHQAPPPLHLVAATPESPPQYAGAAWNRLDDLEAANIQTPLPTPYLRQLLSQVLRELEETPVQQVVCHRDTHPRNMFYNDGKAIFIDWDWAGWDDPMRDPARFFVLGGTPLSELRDGLALYLGRTPSSSEMRHLQLIMLATEIDFYGANQADTSPTHRAVIKRAERIEEFVKILAIQPSGQST